MQLDKVLIDVFMMYGNSNLALEVLPEERKNDYITLVTEFEIFRGVTANLVHSYFENSYEEGYLMKNELIEDIKNEPMSDTARNILLSVLDSNEAYTKASMAAFIDGKT